jgi:hypothetical protein
MNKACNAKSRLIENAQAAVYYVAGVYREKVSEACCRQRYICPLLRYDFFVRGAMLTKDCCSIIP